MKKIFLVMIIFIITNTVYSQQEFNLSNGKGIEIIGSWLNNETNFKIFKNKKLVSYKKVKTGNQKIMNVFLIKNFFVIETEEVFYLLPMSDTKKNQNKLSLIKSKKKGVPFFFYIYYF